MKRLIKFEFLRLKNNKILFFLPLLLVIIGFSGILLNNVYYNETSTPQLMMFNIYNSYAQFTFLFVSFIYIYYFSEDFGKGSYSFYKQIGYSLSKCLFTKAFLLFIISVLTIDFFFIVTALALEINSLSYVLLLISSINVCLLFCIVFSLFLSMLFKKTMIATVINFAIYILCNILNLVAFGLSNPLDGNSLNTTTIKYLATGDLTHKSLSTTSWHFDTLKVPFSIGLPIIYSLLFICIIYFFIRKERKK